MQIQRQIEQSQISFRSVCWETEGVNDCYSKHEKPIRREKSLSPQKKPSIVKLLSLRSSWRQLFW